MKEKKMVWISNIKLYHYSIDIWSCQQRIHYEIPLCISEKINITRAWYKFLKQEHTSGTISAEHAFNETSQQTVESGIFSSISEVDEEASYILRHRVRPIPWVQASRCVIFLLKDCPWLSCWMNLKLSKFTIARRLPSHTKQLDWCHPTTRKSVIKFLYAYSN